jgi:hypothetical protein
MRSTAMLRMSSLGNVRKPKCITAAPALPWVQIRLNREQVLT